MEKGRESTERKRWEAKSIKFPIASAFSFRPRLWRGAYSYSWDRGVVIDGIQWAIPSSIHPLNLGWTGPHFNYRIWQKWLCANHGTTSWENLVASTSVLWGILSCHIRCVATLLERPHRETPGRGQRERERLLTLERKKAPNSPSVPAAPIF